MSHVTKKNQRLIRLFDKQILEFKTLDEDYEICTDDDLEGGRDLIFRIESFRKKLSPEKSERLAKEFNLPSYQAQDRALPSNFHEEQNFDNSQEDLSQSLKQNVGGWQKKLLRDIVKKTHPDKVINYSKPDQDFYANICREATAAYNQGEYVKLMSCGTDVRIKPNPITNLDHLELIKNKITKLSSNISKIKQKHGYIWYHLSEAEKETFLINYMQQLGYSVAKEEVKDVIKRKRPTRKPGTRPENYLRMRRVKK